MHRRVGIYSGTFDPIHMGHVAFAEEAARACGLDKVLFLPEAMPRSKHTVTHITHRTALIELALQDYENLRALRLNTEQFTVQNTLPQLQQLLPNAQLTLLVGSDVVHTFLYRWEGLETLLATCPLAIGMRSRDNPTEIQEIMRRLEATHGVSISYQLIHTTAPHIASSTVRQNIAAGGLNLQLTAYIRQHNLYE